MQLLYGNDGVNYDTVSKSPELTAEQERELSNGYVGYSFVKDSSKYSSAATEPAAIGCVTTNLSGTLPRNMILLSKSARMSNYQTPSYYCHFQLMEASPELYSKGFFSLLKRTFVKDVELLDYKEKSIDTFVSEVDEGIQINTNAIEKEKLTVIVASVMAVADTISKQVSLVVDAEGDEYNKRALDIVATIFSCLPYGVRRNVGFSTYAGADEVGSNRVKLQLYTREAISKDNPDMIDLANMDSRAIAGRLDRMCLEFAKEIVNMEDRDRNVFGSLEIVFGKQKNATVEDHFKFYRNFRRWQNGDLQTMLDELAKTASIEMAKKEEAPVFTIFRSIFNKRFAETGFVNQYNQIMQNMLNEQKDVEFSQKMKAYIMLGEALPVVKFQSEDYVRWLEDTFIVPMESKCEDIEFYGRLERLFKAVVKTRNGGEKFTAVQREMAEHIKSRVVELKAQIEENIRLEEADISSYISDWPTPAKTLEPCIQRYNNIKYKNPNNPRFCQLLVGKIESDLNEMPIFRSFAEYNQYNIFFDDCVRQFSLPPDQVQNVKALINEKGETVIKMETIKNINWNGREDILDTYQSIAHMEAISDGKDVEIPPYSLTVGRGMEYQLSEKDLRDLCGFLLSPQSHTRVYALAKYDDLLEDLIGIGAFTGEHFPILMDMDTLQNWRRKIVKYYMESDALLSKETVDDSLIHLDRETRRELASSMQDSLRSKKNILTTALSNRTERSVAPMSSTTSMSSMRYDTISPEPEKQTAKRKKKEISLPVVLAIALNIISVAFFLSSALVAKTGKIAWPILLSGIFFLVTVAVTVVRLACVKEEEGGFLGTIIGAAVSLLSVWAGWLIFK